MVGMCTRLAIERASAETPHLKRGASDFYPSGAGHPGQDGVNGKPEELLSWRSSAGLPRGGTSRMRREFHVRICEGLGVQLPGPTRRAGQLASLPRHHLSFQATRYKKRLVNADFLPISGLLKLSM